MSSRRTTATLPAQTVVGLNTLDGGPREPRSMCLCVDADGLLLLAASLAVALGGTSLVFLGWANPDVLTPSGCDIGTSVSDSASLMSL